MESKLTEMEQPTVESITKLLKFCKKELEKADEDVYPMEDLITAVRMLAFAANTRGFEECLETDSGRDLIEFAERRITPPDVLTLLSRGYDKDDFWQIQMYTKTFEEIKKKICRQSSVSSTSCSSEGYNSSSAVDRHFGET